MDSAGKLYNHTKTQGSGSGVIMQRKLTSYENVMANFLPAFRFRAASIMANEYKINQQLSANLLGVTQASINKYLNGRVSDKVKLTGLRIDPDSVRAFIKDAEAGRTRDAKRWVCKMCQSYKSFNCSLIIK